MAAASAESEMKPNGNPNEDRALLIVNPVAGTGGAVKIWEELQRTLKDLDLDFDYEFTERPEHAIEIAGEAAKRGYGIVVAVGGDGTIYEVTNGLMMAEREKDRPWESFRAAGGATFVEPLKSRRIGARRLHSSYPESAGPSMSGGWSTTVRTVRFAPVTTPTSPGSGSTAR